ncbi:MAG: RNA polymerase factor sigma-54 [Armatimonadota bacterium]
MQSAALCQRQSLRAIPVQIQANAILNMSLIELQQFIETEAVENPALSVKEGSRCSICGFVTDHKACPVCGASMKSLPVSEAIDERDYLQQVYSAAGNEAAFDPFRTVASTIDLSAYLKQQAGLNLSGRRLRICEYLIDSLDDDGYFRESLFETAEEFAVAVPEIEEVLKVLQSFDPAGIGARDLRECLLIQLRQVALTTDSEESPIISNVERIITDYWDDFAKLKLKSIAKTTEMPIGVVEEAARFIKDRLTPYPASAYTQPFAEFSGDQSAAIVPDVIMRQAGDSIKVDVLDSYGNLLGIDETYEDLYDSIKQGDTYLNSEDCRHIREHVDRVRVILDAIALRKKTLARVASYIAEYQQAFLISGPSKLRPLRQKDIAKALEVHESTICRAVAGKFCKLPSGEAVSFDVFFDSAMPIRSMIQDIIARSAEPLSDSEIANRLSQQGVEIARRTVAKYRDQLRVLPYQLRSAA